LILLASVCKSRFESIHSHVLQQAVALFAQIISQEGKPLSRYVESDRHPAGLAELFCSCPDIPLHFLRRGPSDKLICKELPLSLMSSSSPSWMGKRRWPEAAKGKGREIDRKAAAGHKPPASKLPLINRIG